MGYTDWATADYLTDALDAAERRAYKAEMALEGMGGSAEKSTATRAVEAFITKALSVGAAGGMAYAAHTVFEKNGQAHMPEILGVGLDAVGGLGLTIASFFGLGHKLGLGAFGDHAMDSLGTGLLCHWGVVAGQRAGAASIAGVAGAEASTAGCCGQSEAAAPPAPMGQGSPTDYMSPDQQAAWERYKNAA